MASVVWETGFVAGNLTESQRAVFVSTRDGSAKCTEMMGMDRACKYGYQFSPSERSVALKHISIFEQIAGRHRSGANDAESAFHAFSLVLEDDQFVPRDVRRQIVEITLQAPRDLGLVMLDDSFFFVPSYLPPKERENFPFASSYEKAEGRTMGSYLISNNAAETVVERSFMKPMYAPCDHQLRYAIRKGPLLTHWAWPPVTCAGSQGLETYYTKSTTGGINMDSGDRLNCVGCCDRFVNVTSMRQIYDFKPLPTAE
jgi:GR25 family glycosyltransferase involved in LPS biosynthesis